MSGQPDLTTIQRDSWEEYPTAAAPGNGKGKGHPPVPEPQAYGFWLIAVVLVTLALSRWSNRTSGRGST